MFLWLRYIFNHMVDFNHMVARRWFQIFFMFTVHPYLGKMSNLAHIFPMGWFNHQPVYFSIVMLEVSGCYSWCKELRLTIHPSYPRQREGFLPVTTGKNPYGEVQFAWGEGWETAGMLWTATYNQFLVGEGIFLITDTVICVCSYIYFHTYWK